MRGAVAGSRRPLPLTGLPVGTNMETLGIRRFGHHVEMSSGRRYRQVVAPKKGTDDRDVIAQLADVGENALRRIVERPRRMVDGIEQRLRDFASRLRAIDPLDRRVAALEKRLDSLEKPKAATARRQSSAAKPSTSRTGRAAVADDRARDLLRQRASQCPIDDTRDFGSREHLVHSRLELLTPRTRSRPSGEERGAPRCLSEAGTLFDVARSHSGVSRRPTSTRAPLGRRPRPYPLDGLSHHPPLLSHTTASRVEFSHLSIGLDDSGRAEQRGEEPIEEHADGRPMTGAITSAADRGPAPPLPPAPLSPPRPVPGVPSSAPGRRSGSSRPEGPR